MYSGPANLRGDEQVVLSPNFFSINFIAAKGALLSVEVETGFFCAAQALLCFVLAVVARGSIYWFWALLATAALCSVLAYQLTRLLVMSLSIYHGKLHKPIYRRAMIYWSWWLVIALLLSIPAAVLGGYVGSSLRCHHFTPYHEIKMLQTYDRVEPANISGQQLQDAGIISFAPDVTIDRAKGSCLMVAEGYVYCLAPIATGGNVTGRTHDFFAVGVDCCTCPGTDFHCGEWDNPYAVGGLRATDPTQVERYNVTLQAWKASHNINSTHPIFLDWVYDAPETWRYLFQEGLNTIIVYTLGVGVVLFVVVIFLAKMLQACRILQWAAPVGNPLPPRGFERAWSLLFPDLVECAVQENKQQDPLLPGRPPQPYGSLGEEAGQHRPAALQGLSPFTPVEGMPRRQLET